MRNQRGQAVLGISVAIAMLTAFIYLYASERTSRVAKIYHSTQTANYTHEIAADLAMKLRWAYDMGAASAIDPTLCPVGSGTLVTLNSLPLCLPASGQICTMHPARPQYSICIRPNYELFAKFGISPTMHHNSLVALLLKINSAQAASPFSPPPPVIGETDNALNVNPTCLGGDCEIRCGGPGKNADCLTFKFCPLAIRPDLCKDPDDFVWQTVGFLR